MNTRYLILLVMFGFPGLISNGQFDSIVYRGQGTINQTLIVQVGAFRYESYALALKEKLRAILDRNVIIVTEDGFFKVRIKGFSENEELEKFYSTLSFLGMKDFWVLSVKKQDEVRQQKGGPTDSIIKPVSENRSLSVIGENTRALYQPEVILQIDVFRKKSEAVNAKKIITTKLNLHVEIVQQWNYYKVFVTGFHSTDEANKYFIAIAKLGYPNIAQIVRDNNIQKTDTL